MKSREIIKTNIRNRVLKNKTGKIKIPLAVRIVINALRDEILNEYKCPICGRKFRSVQGIKQHLNRGPCAKELENIFNALANYTWYVKKILPDNDLPDKLKKRFYKEYLEPYENYLTLFGLLYIETPEETGGKKKVKFLG